MAQARIFNVKTLADPQKDFCGKYEKMKLNDNTWKGPKHYQIRQLPSIQEMNVGPCLIIEWLTDTDGSIVCYYKEDNSEKWEPCAFHRPTKVTVESEDEEKVSPNWYVSIILAQNDLENSGKFCFLCKIVSSGQKNLCFCLI